MAVSNKRPVSDDAQAFNEPPSSPKQSTETQPKRPRLAPIHMNNDAAYRSLINPIARNTHQAPLTPQTPSRFLPVPTSNTNIKSKPSRKEVPANSKVNTTIYDLRKQGLGWDDIATKTNSICTSDESAEVSGAACYSRFFRNGPLVAKAKGEKWEKGWYVGMNGPVGDKVLDDAGDGEVAGDVGATDKGEAVDTVVRGALDEVKGEFWHRLLEAVNGRLVAEGKEEIGLGEVQEVYDRIIKIDD